MTQTNLKPKISTVASRPGDTQPPENRNSFKSQDVKADSYSPKKTDSYGSLLKGSTTTVENTPIGDLVSALSESQAHKYKDPLQECLYGLLYGLDKGTPALPEEINVPSFEKLKAANPGIADKSAIAEGIVDRYDALEDLIVGTISNVEESLKPNNTMRMTPAEVKNLQKYRKELERKLFDCRQEMTKAEYTLKWAQDKEEAAAMSAIETAEKDWWED